ncbi:hypothetical protein CJ030_MR2G024071 [Morella rubra]|uniref:RNase H type-1 domain-containing protein n=1 Tax=Morella rubra TaxID=262757 RepID=A0A6A1WFH6_9ROSI|nr:hypothetical protein CJ030_MR2G024071 [Morella rubra]
MVPPASPVVKINFDVACRTSFAVIAAVCRNHEGEILQVRTSSVPIVQPLWSEIKAAHMACIMADEGSWQSVELEGDSLNAYTAITHSGKDMKGYLVADCRACHDYLALYPNWKLSWISRKLNCLAHKIVKWAVQTHRVGHIDLADIPSVILNCDWLYKPP